MAQLCFLIVWRVRRIHTYDISFRDIYLSAKLNIQGDVDENYINLLLYNVMRTLAT